MKYALYINEPGRPSPLSSKAQKDKHSPSGVALPTKRSLDF